MKHRFFTGGLSLGLVLCLHSAFAEVEVDPIHVGSSIDAGQIVEGQVMEDREMNMQFVTRTGVGATFGATINERLHLTVNMGGLFWHSLPELEGQPHTRLIKFGPGVGQASGTYSFGDVENPWGKLQFGLFAHKYNPDVKNLGEYLLRSGCYPGYLWSGGYGGWTMLNGAAHLTEGIRFSTSHMDGAFTQDVSLYMQRFIEPEFDLDLSYLAAYRVGNILEFGAGISFAHLIPISPSKTTPDRNEGLHQWKNGYTTQTVIDRIYPTVGGGEDTTYKVFEGPLASQYHRLPGYELTDSLVLDDAEIAAIIADPNDDRWIGDAATGRGKTIPKKEIVSIDTVPVNAGTGEVRYDTVTTIPARADGKYVSIAQNGIPMSQVNYYTFQGTKLMGRMSFNLQGILESDAL